MSNSFVHTIIRRSNRNLLLLCSAGALLLVALAALNTRYFYNFFAGPVAIDRKALLDSTGADALQRYWVTVKGDEVIDTGTQQVSRNRKTGSETVTGAYMALVLDDRLLIVKAPDDKEVTEFTGYLEAMPSDVHTEIVDEAEREMPDLRGAFLPFMLNTGSFRSSGYIGLGLGIPLFGLCLWGIVRAIQRGTDPSTHPIMRALGRFGPPDYVAGEINVEVLADHQKVGNLYLTPNWLVQATSSKLDATRIDDVIWAYKQVTQHRTNGLPTGKTYAAQIWDRYGVCITVTGKEAFVNQVIEAAAQRVPWILAGYSPDLEKAWKTNQAALIDAVDQRRQHVLAQLQGAPGPA